MLALEIKGLTLKYKSWTSKQTENVFDNLNLSVAEGEKALILANSDEGKTTLSRLLSNLLLKFIPCEISGSIKLFDNDITKFEPYDLVEQICYVSQNPMEMFITTTVENEIAFPFETLGIERSLIIKKVNKAIKEWGLEKYRDVSPSELSGGERKRLLLAVTFALNSKIILLDEAFDDLDKDYRALLAKKVKESKSTVLVFSARYLTQFEDVFDTINVLENKQIVKNENFKNKFTHQDVTTYLNDTRLIYEHEKRVENILINKEELQIESLEIERVRESSKSNNFKLLCNDFSIKTGEIVRLVGNNGSGKSTLSRVLCGLDSPIKGKVLLNKKEVEEAVLRTKIAYLFQNPDLQIFLPTVKEELAYGLENDSSYSSEEIKSKVSDCAALFNLDLDETPSTMSFALRKFLQAGVYYLLDRPFIIFDEIDGAMNYEDAYYIIDKLSERGAAIIIITHDDSFAKSISDRTYIAKSGKVEVVKNE
ncbi:MAG: ATP-binding cassette domain-containing protein [Pleomorphochaeta sp.]